jgi:sorbitol/mannitol transport system permease protein
MFVTAFKTEHAAVYPSFAFNPTFETLGQVITNPNIVSAMRNSVFHVILGTTLAVVLGVPASFHLAFGEFRKRTTSENLFIWFLVTIILPPIAILIPVYTWFQQLNMLGSPWSLLFLYVGFHTPIVIWLTHSFFTDLPSQIMEAASLDGCSPWQKLWHVGVPLVKPGIGAAALLVGVLIWNEFFLGFNLTGNQTATLPVYLSRFREQQGLYVAQLSAASTVAVLPPMIGGWLAQKALVHGLTKGAVKG